MKVAFLSATCMIAGHPTAREDYWEHDREFVPMRDACAALGIELSTEIWDDPGLDPGRFDALVIGTTWDYAEQAGKYLATLEGFARERPLFNPPAIVRWNLSKTYLRDLADRGAPVVKTLWCDRADEATIGGAFDELGVDEIVVKPEVGASAWRQVRLHRGDAIPAASELPPDRALMQPFLHAAANEGEYTFVFFDGEFSHCALKVPKAGDYRVQSMYGASERAYSPTADELALARGVLELIGEPLLYARVDMMRDAGGHLVVMELELIEPYLYPDQGGGMGAAFASALQGRLHGRS